MSKQLLVRTPVTTDGITLKYDEAKQPMFTETILPLTARKDFEILNASLPEHLRHQLVEEEFKSQNYSQKANETASLSSKGKN